MASESTEGAVSVDLPSELHDWLEEKATELGVEREQLLVQLVAAYRTAAEVDDGPAVLGPPDGSTLPADAVADAVDGRVADIIDEQVSDTVEEHVADAVEEQLGSTVRESAEPLVTERVNESTKAVQRQLGDRIDGVEEEFTEKLEDVRERVIQVKKEADVKAPADHTHEQLEAVADIDRSVATLEDELAELRSTVEEAVPEHESKITEVDARIAEMEDRLKTVAWVVSDLRDAHESGKGLEAVERIKRAAAKADIERAKCENCGNKVTLALLTDPACPHCDATVTNVEPDPGWFRKPKLRVASQLESGDPE
jgi:flagellar motility protein MotE (MotC chaperone)